MKEGSPCCSVTVPKFSGFISRRIGDKALTFRLLDIYCTGDEFISIDMVHHCINYDC